MDDSSLFPLRRPYVTIRILQPFNMIYHWKKRGTLHELLLLLPHIVLRKKKIRFYNKDSRSQVCFSTFFNGILVPVITVYRWKL